MPDSVNVPALGQVKKGNLVIGALAGVAVGGYALIKHNQAKAAAAATTTNTTGYGYGYGYGAYGYGTVSPYGEMYGYGALGYGMYGYGGAYEGTAGVGGSYSGGIYGYGGTGVIGQPTTNSEWAQAAIAALEAQGVSAATALGAISVYLLGGHLSTAQLSVVQEAIALEGYPPNPPTSSTSTGGGDGQGGNGVTGTTTYASNPPKNLRLVRNGPTGIQFQWDPVPNATSYTVKRVGGGQFSTTSTVANAGSLKPGTKYTFQVWGDPTPTGGPHATLTVTTTK